MRPCASSKIINGGGPRIQTWSRHVIWAEFGSDLGEDVQLQGRIARNAAHHDHGKEDEM